MRSALLLVMSFFLCGSAVVAQSQLVSTQLGKMCKVEQINYCEEDESSLANQQEYTPTVPITGISLGTAGNLYTILRNTQNVIAVDQASGTMAFIHRNDPAIGDLETPFNSTSQYRLDVSRDGGQTWENNSPALNPNTPGNDVPNGQGRYPQVALYNPIQSDNPDDVWFFYAGATHDGLSTNVWDGQVWGRGELKDIAGSVTEANIEAGDESINTGLIPGSLVAGRPGEFWNIDFEYLPDPNNAAEYYVADLHLFKGTINSDGEATYQLEHVLKPNYDLSADGTPTAGTPMLAFSPDGEIGYVVFLGDGAIEDCGQWVLSPVMFMTTDGGESWSEAKAMNLTNLDGFLDYTGETEDGTVVDWTPGLNGDADVIVDQNGALHIGTVVGQAFTDGIVGPFGVEPNGGYGIQSGATSLIVADFIYSPDEDSWGAIRMDTLISFETGGNVPGTPFTLYQQMQASRTASGDKVFFTWTDSLTQIPAARDIKGFGIDVTTGMTTQVKSFTADDAEWAGLAYWTRAATHVYTDNGVNSIATVATTILTDDENQVQFTYLDEISFADDEFTEDAITAAYTSSPPAYTDAMPMANESGLCYSITFSGFTSEVCYAVVDFGDGSTGSYTAADIDDEGNLVIDHQFPNETGAYEVVVTMGNLDGEVSETFEVSTEQADDSDGPNFSFLDESIEIVDGAASITVEAEPNTGSDFTYPEYIADDAVSCNVTDLVIVSGGVNDQEPGSYDVTFTAADPAGNETVTVLTVNIEDTVGPDIIVDTSEPVCVGTTFDPAEYFSAANLSVVDQVDGSLSDQVQFSEINTDAAGEQEITLTVEDASGNSTSETAVINVEEGTEACPVSVDAVLSAKFDVFPNPTQGLFVLTGSDTQNASISIYNVVGELVASYNGADLRSEYSIDLSAQASGMYVVYIETAEGLAAKRIMLSK